ncbi:rhodanese-like domain-containing protein [Vibrio sonorensis]|uniref:rhodanese-like domain-containing protein n=1 Tax=Vibrio sonorensis TaxID=1004316 RepID=UPI0008DABDB7|nr:rhodanese-like domain-containing protein [Vibrio sonorensis]
MFRQWIKPALISALFIGAIGSTHASDRAKLGWVQIEDGALLIDVRTPEEFASGHLEGAVNIPLSELEQRLNTVDKSKQTVLYCRSGRRSGVAYEILRNAGYDNIHNAGGYSEMLSVKP